MDDEVEREETPRTKEALSAYANHLGKSRAQQEMEFIDQRKAQRDKDAKNKDELSQILSRPLEVKAKIAARIEASKPKPNVKTADYNLAKIGSKQDLRGVKYSHEKSVKKFLDDRKRKIEGADEDIFERAASEG